MQLHDLVAPMPVDQFLRDHWGKRPVHLPAPAGMRGDAVGDWAGLNVLLGIRAHWTSANIKLVMNNRAVDPSFYLDDDMDGNGTPRRLASAAKVDHLLAIGASLVANAIEEVSPQVRALTTSLADAFSAKVMANLYASFQGVQAFASHYDTHDVFAIQCSGEKRWRIYANRTDNPIATPQGDGAQATIDAAKGGVAMDVTLRAGDVLYVPRGYFHDAIATASESLHLTVGVLPHTGKLLLRLLDDVAMEEAAFRAYLPDAREDGGAALQAHLAALANRLATLAASPRVREVIADRQRAFAAPMHQPALPLREEARFYARTQRPAEVVRLEAGAVLRTASGDVPLGPRAAMMEHLIARPAMAVAELAAAFPHHGRAAAEALIADAVRLGLIERYEPKLRRS